MMMRIRIHGFTSGSRSSGAQPRRCKRARSPHVGGTLCRNGSERTYTSSRSAEVNGRFGGRMSSPRASVNEESSFPANTIIKEGDAVSRRPSDDGFSPSLINSSSLSYSPCSSSTASASGGNSVAFLKTQTRGVSFMRSGLQSYKRMSRGDSRSWIPQASTHAPPTSIEAIPHPRDMDATLVGQAASVAARERFTSPQFWRLLCERARELVNQFEAQDMALLLNGMTRLQIQNPELIEMLIPRIWEKLVFFNSTYLSMTLAALGKLTHKGYPPEFLEAVAKELQGRIYEFYSPTEISMLVNAIVRLEIKNARLIILFAEHACARMRMDSFHVRDLSVIAHAFSRAEWPQEAIVGQRPRQDVLGDLFGRIFAELERTLDEATPQELARLVTAFAKAEVPTFDKIFPYCLKAARDQVIFMTPKQLSTAAFAFGEVLEIAPRDCVPDLHKLFKVFEKGGVQALHLFAYEDLISFLTSYARWHLNFDEKSLVSFLRRAKTLSIESSPGNARNLIITMAVLSHRNCREVPPEATIIGEMLTQKAFQNVDSGSIVKLVSAMDKLKVPQPQWLECVTSTLSSDIRLGSRSLYDRLKECDVDEEEDIMLAMGELYSINR